MSVEQFPGANPEQPKDELVLRRPETGVNREVRITGLAVKLSNRMRGKEIGHRARTMNMQWLLGELEMIPRATELEEEQAESAIDDEETNTWELLKFNTEYVKAEDTVIQFTPSQQRGLVTGAIMNHPVLDVLINAAQMMGDRERTDLVLMQRAATLLITNFSEEQA